MTTAKLLTALLLLATTGCGANAGQPVVPGAGEVVLSEDAAPAGFEELQTLSVQSGKGCGFTGESGSRQEADSKLRGEAAKLGATFVRITDVQAPHPNHQCLEKEYKLTGVAYRKVVAARAAVVQDYEPGAPISKPSEASAVSRLGITLAAGDPTGNALSVEYGCSGTEQRALLDVWSEPRTSDWSTASALSFRIKPDAAISLSVSFMDANHAGYTQKTPPLVANVWQTVRLPFDKFWLNPFGPQGDTPGRPQDRTKVQAFGFAPDGCTNGHFLIDDFTLSPP